MKVVYTPGNVPINLGDELGRGGEAIVYAGTHPTYRAIKIYSAVPEASLVQKLHILVDLSSQRLSSFCAFPLSVVLDRPGGRVIGYAMPRGEVGLRPLHQLYGPRDRKEYFPDATWKFLVHMARNLAQAVALLHETGIVVGDLNPNNILAGPRGDLFIVDVDSFQVANATKVYRCTVGMPDFLAPELIGARLDAVDRTPAHDNFVLATLIFHLLNLGRHPFQGRWKSPEEFSYEFAISDHRFAYSSSAAARGIEPPPLTLALTRMGGACAKLFERAFVGSISTRPTAKEWVTVLEALRDNMRVCTHIGTHTYLDDGLPCPWCQLEEKGAILFNFVAAVSASTGLDVEELWRRICLIDPPPQTQAITVAAASPDSAAIRFFATRRSSHTLAVIMAALCANIAAWSSLFSTLIPSDVLSAAILVTGFVSFLSWAMGPKLSVYENRLKQSIDARDQLLLHSERNAAARFEAKRLELKVLCDVLRNFPARRAPEVAKLTARARDLQLADYLDRYSIMRAFTGRLGIGKLAILLANGIDSAKEVSYERLVVIVGIGPAIAQQLVDWRTACESKFVFDLASGVPREQLARLDGNLFLESVRVEEQVRLGTIELEKITRDATETKALTAEAILSARYRVEKARANLRAAKRGDKG